MFHERRVLQGYVSVAGAYTLRYKRAARAIPLASNRCWHAAGFLIRFVYALATDTLGYMALFLPGYKFTGAFCLPPRARSTGSNDLLPLAHQ
ncbi:MAG TPA: hypothetical protein VJU59_16865 [Paraburkholderia sp.]|uniref:hypothetical protein n=1 Tax=Paraburkholderia sp. TaxID=1926495 RepID=UPI002B49C70D|nr:hypothetical protein [Paraburkholderia sp.]HKR41322.1 hypothetical protein [Paraburkholderia sp.]